MLFRKTYTVRHYGPQSFKQGYAAQAPTETTAALDIQPDNDSLEALADGNTTVGRIKVWSSAPFTAADRDAGVKGDCVLWNGRWYECTKAQKWDGTPLAHYFSTFTIIPEVEVGDV